MALNDYPCVSTPNRLPLRELEIRNLLGFTLLIGNGPTWCVTVLHLMFAVVSPVLVPYWTASLWLHHTYFHQEFHIWYRFSCTFRILALSKINQIVVMLVKHMLFSYCDQQIVSNGIFIQISCTGIYLGCLDVPALINKIIILFAVGQGHMYHVLTPPLIPWEHEYNTILGVTVRFLVVSFKSWQSWVRPLDSSRFNGSTSNNYFVCWAVLNKVVGSRKRCLSYCLQVLWN